MSFVRTADRSTAYPNNGFKLRNFGVTQSRPGAPFLHSLGSVVSATTGAASPAWPAHEPGDLGILVWECSGNGTTITPSGWNLFTGSPVVDVATNAGSKLNVAWRFATNNAQSNASIGNTGDHVVARIHVFRGVSNSTVPGRAFASNTKTTASFVLSFPEATTLAPNSLIIGISTRPDDSASTANFAGYTNASLTSFTEIGEAGTTSGDGGGFVVWSGIASNIGATGATSATSVVSTTNAYFVFALEPSLALPA